MSKCAIVEVVRAVAAAIVLLVEAIVLQWLLLLLLLFVAGKLDDVATIRSGSPFGVLVGSRLDLLKGDRHEMCLAWRVLGVVGNAEGRLQLQLAFPPGQLLWHWRRDDEFLLRQRRKSQCAAAMSSHGGKTTTGQRTQSERWTCAAGTLYRTAGAAGTQPACPTK
jgi:hypothetical protein